VTRARRTLLDEAGLGQQLDWPGAQAGRLECFGRVLPGLR